MGSGMGSGVGAELRELYREVILDHSRRPRNYGNLDGANRSADGFNPLCGDRLQLFLRVEDGVVRGAAFTGEGCAISTASASLLTEMVRGREEAAALRLVEAFRRLASGEDEDDPGNGSGDGAAEAAGADLGEALGKLGVFAGVRDYPARVKCATLPWHTLRAAIEDDGAVATTE